MRKCFQDQSEFFVLRKVNFFLTDNHCKAIYGPVRSECFSCRVNVGKEHHAPIVLKQSKTFPITVQPNSIPTNSKQNKCENMIDTDTRLIVKVTFDH